MRYTVALTVLLSLCSIAAADEAPVTTYPNPTKVPLRPQNAPVAAEQPADVPLVMAEFKFIETKNGKDETLTAPKLTVPSGQTGLIMVGTNISAPPQIKADKTISDRYFIGNKLEVMPRVRDDGKIELNFTIRRAQLDTSGPANSPFPRIEVREIQSGVVAASGQTVTVGGMKTEGSEFRVMITPTIVAANDAAKDSAVR